MVPTPPAVPRSAPAGDEAQLFRTRPRRRLELVARDVTARPEVIEDACAFAWLELVARQPERTNIMGWLRVVASERPNGRSLCVLPALTGSGGRR